MRLQHSIIVVNSTTAGPRNQMTFITTDSSISNSYFLPSSTRLSHSQNVLNDLFSLPLLALFLPSLAELASAKNRFVPILLYFFFAFPLLHPREFRININFYLCLAAGSLFRVFLFPKKNLSEREMKFSEFPRGELLLCVSVFSELSKSLFILGSFFLSKKWKGRAFGSIRRCVLENHTSGAPVGWREQGRGNYYVGFTI